MICVIILLFLWAVSMYEVFWASRGPDVEFKLDSNHQLMGWPGFLVQYKPDGSSDVVMIKNADSQEFCPSAISKYAVTEKYIVAKAEEGWLAINRTSLQVWGCYQAIEELEKIVGVRFGVLDLVEEFTRSEVYIPQRTWYAMTCVSLMFLGIIVGILFSSALFKKTCISQK